MSPTEAINIEPLSPQNEKEWDRLVQIAHNGHLMARPGFFRYHADRFDDASLFIRRGKRPLAVLPANSVGATLYSHQGVSFGGLILHPRARFDDAGAAVSALVAHLRSAGFDKLIYRPAPHPYHLFPREEDIYWLEEAGARKIETKLHSMVLCCSDAPVQAKKWSRSIRIAGEGDVHLRRGSLADLPVVWNEVERLLARHDQTPVHGIEEIALLIERFGEEIPMTVAEDIAGEFLAGHIVFRFGRTITGMYLGETERGRELQAGVRIHHEHLTAPANAGFWLDLGQWCDTDTREPSNSLLQFKENAGGRLVRRHAWQLDLA